MPLPPDFDPDAPAAAEDGLFGLPWTPDEAKVCVVPVPFEATTSFGRGTAGGPAAVLEASWQVDLHDLDTPNTWRAGLAMVTTDGQIEALNSSACEAALPLIAMGGSDGSPASEKSLNLVNEAGRKLNQWVFERTRQILSNGQIPAILGGDHSVPFGAIQAAADLHPGLGVLHIDAHADLREAYEGFTWSHASIFHNVMTKIPHIGPLSQVGLRDLGRSEATFATQDPKIHWFTDLWIGEQLAEGRTWKALCDEILAPLPKHVWISFDIDGLDPSLCPHTGTPVPGGLRWREALFLLKALAASGRTVVGFDLCEVGQEPFDANVGARLLYKLAGHAIHTHHDS